MEQDVCLRGDIPSRNFSKVEFENYSMALYLNLELLVRSHCSCGEDDKELTCRIKEKIGIAGYGSHGRSYSQLKGLTW